MHGHVLSKGMNLLSLCSVGAVVKLGHDRKEGVSEHYIAVAFIVTLAILLTIFSGSWPMYWGSVYCFAHNASSTERNYIEKLAFNTLAFTQALT